MEPIEKLTEIDWGQVLIIFFTVIIGFTTGYMALKKFLKEVFHYDFDPFGKRRKEHELLVATVNGLSELQKKHESDVIESIKHDKLIKEELSVFMSEIRDSIKDTQNQMNQFANNRVNDRGQSLNIQKELTDSIKIMAEKDVVRDKQIEALTNANKELLADKINQKYKEYVRIGGVPSDEVDEFTNLHKSYNCCGGNSHGDAKYNYVMEHLPVIPVETKLVYKH